MNLGSQLHSPIVLSYGRTGSVLLAANLEKSLNGVDARADKIKYVKELPFDFTAEHPTVFHSHLKLDRSIIPGLTRVFSLRLNPIEHILSFVMVDKFKHYHLRNTWAKFELEPFVFDQWHMIDQLCRDIKDWHEYYVADLAAEDFVINYEVMIRGLKPDQPWQKIYPDKHCVIQNHMDVVNYIVTRFNWQPELDVFAKHRARFDLYPYATG